MSTVSRWETIARDIEAQIQSGTYGSGQRLPSEAELCRLYGVSRMTVRQAMGELETRGLLVRHRGKGTFISERKVRRSGNVLGSFHEELGVSEDDLKTLVVGVEVVTPPPNVADDLDLSEIDTTVRFNRLRVLEGKPISSQLAWVPTLLDPTLAREPLIHGSIYRTFSERLGLEIDRALQFVTASAATDELAEVLGCAPGSALIDVSRVSYATTGSPVVSARSWPLPDFPLSYELKR